MPTLDHLNPAPLLEPWTIFKIVLMGARNRSPPRLPLPQQLDLHSFHPVPLGCPPPIVFAIFRGGLYSILYPSVPSLKNNFSIPFFLP